MAIKKKYQDSVSMVAEVNEGVDNNAATETVVAEVREESKGGKASTSLSELLSPKKEELKSGSLTIRVKPSVKKKFESFCKRKGVSRAAMFEFWVESITTK